jgi:protein-tyrosine-phosphatase
MASEPRVNQMRDDLSDELLQWREEGRLPLEALSPLLTVARRFERVSDQATNICEEALYFATGEYLRHLPREGFRVLFVDETNGCLSRIAEVIGNALGAKRFWFNSAGLTAGAADPRTVWFLSEKGFDISRQPSKSVSQVIESQPCQIMVALSKEAEKAFPQRPTKVLGLQWVVPDPSKARGAPEEIRAEYERAYLSLTHHIRDLVHAIIGDGQASSDQELGCRS